MLLPGLQGTHCGKNTSQMLRIRNEFARGCASVERGNSNPLNATLRLARSTKGNSSNSLSSTLTAFNASCCVGFGAIVGIHGSGPITSNPVAGSKPSFANTVPSRRKVGAQIIPVTVGKPHLPYPAQNSTHSSFGGLIGFRTSFFHDEINVPTEFGFEESSFDLH